MKRQLLVNGAILALAFGTLGLVWLTRQTPTTSQLEARKGKLLATWSKEQVTRVVVERGDQKLVLVRAKPTEEFRIEKPWSERADVATVNALLGSLDLASALRPADGISAEQAGLGPQALRLTLQIAGKSQSLALGGPAPAPAGARYAQVTRPDNTTQLFVVSQGVGSELDVPLDNFREARLLEYGKSEIAEIVIEQGDTKLTLPQAGHVFRLKTEAGLELADREATERVLTALSRVVAERFVEPGLARASLGKEAVKVGLKLLEPGVSAITLTFGAGCPDKPELGLVLREQAGRSPKAGCVPAQLIEALRVKPAEVALNRPFSARADEVEELVVKVGSDKLELARKGNGFVLKAPSNREVALDAGNQRITAIVAAKAERVSAPNSAELGLEPAAGEITIQLSGSDDTSSLSEKILLGKPRRDGSLCLKRLSDSVVLCVPSQAAPSFRAEASLLKSLDVLSFAPSELVTLSLDGPQLHQRLRRKEDGTYELEAPPGFRHDGQAVSSAISLLGTLRAERWVSDRDDGSHGLANPRLRVSIETSAASGPSKRELTVGAGASDGYFAALSSESGVFVIARSAVTAVEEPLIDRALCPVSADELQQLELAAGPRHLRMTRQGATWQGPGKTPERAQELAETLQALRASGAVHLGAAEREEGFDKPSLTVTFVTAQGGRRRLLLRAHDETAAYARLDGVAATFTLPPSTYAALLEF